MFASVRRATAAVLAAGALGAAGSATANGQAPGTALSARARQPVAVLDPLASSAPMPTADGVARAAAGVLAHPALGGAPHVQVVDATTGVVLLDRDGRVPALPASNEKLLTAAAALTVLGPRTRFTTRAFSFGADVYLVGDGDPTVATRPELTGYPMSADLTQLAHAVARKLPRGRSTSRVIAVGSDYVGPDEAPGWTPSYLADGEVSRVRSLLVDEAKLTPGLAPGPRAADPLLAAAQSFAAALTTAGAPSGSAIASPARSAPRGAHLLATVVSPPVSALVERMLTWSDADIAEGLARQVALRSGRPASFAGVAAALTAVAHQLHLPDIGRFADGSGLSRTNAIAPSMLTALLREAAESRHQELGQLAAALPIAGFTGTLTTRFTGAAASGAGRVRAKTGWLNGAAALSGYVTTAEGRLLIFAALAPAQERSGAESALDRFAATLASCGCR